MQPTRLQGTLNLATDARVPNGARVQRLSSGKVEHPAADRVHCQGRFISVRLPRGISCEIVWRSRWRR